MDLKISCVKNVESRTNNTMSGILTMSTEYTRKEGAMEFTKAAKLESRYERECELIERLESNYSNAELLGLCREAYAYDGSFDFCDTFEPEEINELFPSKTPYDIMCMTYFGKIEGLGVDTLFRLNAYGNLESTDEFMLEHEASDNVGELAAWLLDNYNHVDGLCEEDCELLEAWEHGCDEDEDE